MTCALTPDLCRGTEVVTSSPHLFEQVRCQVRDLEFHVSHLGERLAFHQLRQLEAQLGAGYERDRADRWAFEALAHQLRPILHESTFCRYTYEKPRGYAGDFQAMEMIWRGHTQPHSDRYLGQTVRGQLVTAYLLDSANSLANVERVLRLRDVLCALEPKRVASVGAGSAIEIGEAVGRGAALRAIDLFDQDDGALAAASRRLRCYSLSVRPRKGNVVRAILKGQGEPYDLIYSSGMFDYFQTSSARRLVAHLWQRLAEGGRLIITNARPENPTRCLMELAADWHLIYKSADEMYSLVDGLPGVDDVSLETDQQGVYQYLTLRRS